MGTNQVWGMVERAAPARGFDTNVVVTAEVARKFAVDGYRFCVRYVSHDQAEGQYDISRGEAETILGANLALMVVQHVRRSGWSPTAALGSSDGALAAQHLAGMGAPPRLTVWTDIEGLTSDVPAAAIIAYANAWYTAVAAAGYTPGLYVGTFRLTSAQLYWNLKFRNYWKSGMAVADVERRGYQMIQQSPGNVTMNGIHIDNDVVQADDLGDLPTWWVGSSEVATS